VTAFSVTQAAHPVLMSCHAIRIVSQMQPRTTKATASAMKDTCSLKRFLARKSPARQKIRNDPSRHSVSYQDVRTNSSGRSQSTRTRLNRKYVVKTVMFPVLDVAHIRTIYV
jgi:hypothetical protein